MSFSSPIFNHAIVKMTLGRGEDIALTSDSLDLGLQMLGSVARTGFIDTRPAPDILAGREA
jgi:hypothetical protein